MAKTPAKQNEKPADPLAQAHVHLRESTPRMPALSQAQRPVPGHNSDRSRAVEILNGGMARLAQLDGQIGVLNRGKADVFAELKAQGFDVGTVRRVIKERKLDPLVREDREALFSAYWDAVESEPAVEAGEKAA